MQAPPDAYLDRSAAAFAAQHVADHLRGRAVVGGRHLGARLDSMQRTRSSSSRAGGARLAQLPRRRLEDAVSSPLGARSQPWRTARVARGREIAMLYLNRMLGDAVIINHPV